MTEESALVESITAALSEPAAQPEPAPETPVADATPAAPTPDVQQPAPEPAPVEAQAPAPQANDPKHGLVPIAAMLDEREKRQELERRLKEFEDTKASSQPREIPSIQDNPEAFAAHLAEETARTTLNLRFDISEETARAKHGDDTVQSAMDWGMSKSGENPAFAAEYVKQKNPVDWVVKQHKRDKLLGEIGDDPDEYVRKRYAEIAGAAQPNGAGQPTQAQPLQPTLQSIPAKPTPTPSLASAPNAGGGVDAVPTHGVAAIDAVFR